MYKSPEQKQLNNRLKAAWLIAVITILTVGLFYRNVASKLGRLELKDVNLPIELKHIPLNVKNWSGKETPVQENIERIIGNDDYLNRLYINKQTNQAVNLYISYTGNPRTMLGHRPQVCYTAGGWMHDFTEKIQIQTTNQKKIPALLHRFYNPAKQTGQIFVLNYYILNGKVTNDEQGFSGLNWRSPNIDGNPARYVAQVQISAMLENSCRIAAGQLTDTILNFLPDKNGQVNANRYVSQSDPKIKIID